MMTTFPVYGVTPADGTLDTSFDQGSGFNKQVFGVTEYGDEYVFWGDNGTTYYSSYQGVSSINSNRISPFFRVRTDSLLPDTNTILNGNLNAINSSKHPFCVGGGYIYSAGFFTRYGGDVAVHLVKLNAIDMTFVSGNTGVGISSVATVQIRYANSKVFMGFSGNRTFNGGTSTRLVVFNEDLTVDTTLTTFFAPNASLGCIFEQADGKVVMLGGFTSIGGTTQNRIVRYNTDRTVDTTFTTNVGTGPNSGTGNVDIQQLSDGKLVIGGGFITFNGTASQRVIVLNTDGTISTAVASGFSSGNVGTIGVDGSDNIFCGGNFTSYAGTGRVGLAKLSSTLTLDATYDAVLNSGTVYSLVVNGTSLCVGTDSDKTVDGVAISGLFATDLVNGDLTNNFNGGINSFSNINKLFISGNYIYVYGGTNFNTLGRVRGFDGEFTQFVSFVDKNGFMTKNLDKFYVTSVNTPSILYVLKEGNDLYVATNATDGYGGLASVGVIKFTDKILDTTFTSTSTAVTGMIYDNGLIICGLFTTPKNRIVKLDSTGSSDGTFDVGTGLNSQTDWITKLSNGNYLVTGSFTTYKGVTTNRICVLDNTGNKVGTFVEGTGLGSSILIRSLELSNGNYLVYGNITTYKGAACNRAIILDATGTQVTWLSSNFNGTINKAVEYNGKVYFTGAFTTFGATTVNYLACIDLATGTLENIFGTGLNGTGNDLIIDNGGKLVVVGNFTTYNGNTVGYVARIFI